MYLTWTKKKKKKKKKKKMKCPSVLIKWTNHDYKDPIVFILGMLNQFPPPQKKKLLLYIFRYFHFQ